MKTKLICLTALLMLAALCRIAPSAIAANEGDYTPTDHVQWWWKYVLPVSSQAKWVQYTRAHVEVGKDEINPRTQDTTNTVIYNVMNTTADYVKCDGSVTLMHTIRAADGSVRYQETLGKGYIGALAPGQTVQIRGAAFTPSKLGGFNHFVEVQVQ